MKVNPKIIEAFKKAFKETGAYHKGIPHQNAALGFVAQALQLPVRQGVMSGENGVMELFQEIPMENGTIYHYPIDLLAPGSEDEFTARAIPREGDLPTIQVEGDYVMVPTFPIGNGISWRVQFARDAGYEVLARCTEILKAGFVKKRNDDGFKVVIAAGYDRNIAVFDPNASQGEFTKRVVSYGKSVFRRNAGGNAASLNQRFMTDLYLSTEMVEGMRNWGVDQADDFTRREIYVADDNDPALSRVFGINLHDTFELGEGQEYQSYYTSLGGSLASGDVELMIGTNNNASNSFITPLREPLQIFPDGRLDYFQLVGLWGRMEYGMASLDNRDTLLLTC